jgi:GntR family transcriptional regulator
MNTIVRDSKLPFYHQLYEILRGEIVSGTWQPGDILPSESELIDQYEVSRITVRQGLEALVNDGLIYRQRGRGTFVAHPTVEQGLNRIVSFTEDMQQRGFRSGTELLTAELTPASKEIAEKLQVDPAEELAHLERLRLADGEAMSVEESYLIHRLCPGILQGDYAQQSLLQGDYAQQSLRETLARQHGLHLVRAKQTIRAILTPAKLAAKLSVPPRSALLFIERVSFSNQNTPIEFLRLYHRGDRYVLYNELRE